MVNPSPYMSFFDFGDWQLIGSSPEVMVQADPAPEGIRASLRPIAGTRPRGTTAHEDRDLELDLLADPKERAEQVMLVDLGRNDLGRVCQPGSVAVKDLMVIERYSHVMHIVSQVEGACPPSVWDLLMASPHRNRQWSTQDPCHAADPCVEPMPEAPIPVWIGGPGRSPEHSHHDPNHGGSTRSLRWLPGEGAGRSRRRCGFEADGGVPGDPQQSTRHAHCIGLPQPRAAMSEGLLLKGFEVELFTGRPDGTYVGVASEVARSPVRHRTGPPQPGVHHPSDQDPDALPEALLRPRRRLRMAGSRGLTLLPGSTWSWRQQPLRRRSTTLSRSDRSDRHQSRDRQHSHQSGNHRPGLAVHTVWCAVKRLCCFLSASSCRSMTGHHSTASVSPDHSGCRYS